MGVRLNRALPDRGRRVGQPLDGRNHGQASIERDDGVLGSCGKHQRSAWQQHSADRLCERDHIWVWPGYAFADLRHQAGQKHVRAYLVAVGNVHNVQIRTSRISQSPCDIVQRPESVKRKRAVFSRPSGRELAAESECRGVGLNEHDSFGLDAGSKGLQCCGQDRSDCM